MKPDSSLQRNISIYAISLPRSTKRFLALSLDVCLCILTVWLALCLRFESWVRIDGNQWLPVIISPVLAIPLFIAFGLYKAVFRFAGRESIIAITRAVGIYAVMYSAIFTAVGFADVPRTIGLLQPVLLLISVIAMRQIAKELLGDPYIASQDNLTVRVKVLIYGAGNTGVSLAESLTKNNQTEVLGFIDDNSSLHKGQIKGLNVYSPKDLLAVVQKLHIHDVLLAMPNIQRTRRIEILRQLSMAHVAVRTVPSLSNIAQGKISEADLQELDIEDLLGRDRVAPDQALLEKNIRHKVVLVTGAGGSIGSELCRQILLNQPSKLVLVELNEFALYTILEELNSDKLRGATEVFPILASVDNKDFIREIIQFWRPHTIYHAAAYKHVPLVESNPLAGMRNNILGTLHVAQSALDFGVSNMVLISTDKAVRPTNIMGATKRIAEMVLQGLAEIGHQQGIHTRMSMVRFGNVLGSSGSVVPKFREQIKQGGPITLTHPDITRYFMTISEAAQLVIQAGAMTAGSNGHADVFLLEMGQPVKIIDLARSMVQLSGLTVRDATHPDGDIAIEMVGLRPGEKLYEELLIGNHPQPTTHAKIFYAKEDFLHWIELSQQLQMLYQQDALLTLAEIKLFLKNLVPDYQPEVVY
jgi:FlaA1/EpsC-like NDP-sugar epimerase